MLNILIFHRKTVHVKSIKCTKNTIHDSQNVLFFCSTFGGTAGRMPAIKNEMMVNVLLFCGFVEVFGE